VNDQNRKSIKINIKMRCNIIRGAKHGTFSDQWLRVKLGKWIDAVYLFVRLSVAKMRTQNAILSKTKQFRAMVAISDL